MEQADSCGVQKSGESLSFFVGDWCNHLDWVRSFGLRKGNWNIT